MAVSIDDIVNEPVLSDRVESVTQEDLYFRRGYVDIDASGIGSDSWTYTVVSDDLGNPEVIPPGGEFPQDEEDYERRNVTFEKIGDQIPVHREAQDDTRIDVIANQVDRLAEQMREELDLRAFNEMEDNNSNAVAGDENDTFSFADVLDGRATLRDRGWSPDTLVVDTDAYSDLLNQAEFNRAIDLDNEVIREGALGRVAGLDVYETNIRELESPSHSGSDPRGGFIFDSSAPYGYEVTRESVGTNQYDDPNTQTDYLQIWTRKAFDTVHASAAAQIDG